MNQKTLFKLEYDKIIALLEKEATSFRGGQLCRRLKPMTDLHKINIYQEQTAAAYTRIVTKRTYSRLVTLHRLKIHEASGRLVAHSAAQNFSVFPACL